jgi:hypothetical protein
MKDIEKEFRLHIHKLVKEHLSEIKQTAEALGFESFKNMLSCIKKDTHDALWALTELMSWAMTVNYKDRFIIGIEETEDETSTIIYHFIDSDSHSRYFKIVGADVCMNMVEMKLIEKQITIKTWKEWNNANK